MIKYFKTLWENNITPVNGRNLNKIEDALEYLCDVIRNVPSEENIRIANEKQRQKDETTRSNSEIKRNATFDSKIKDVDKAINASNENIVEVNNKFESITASKQQDAEVIIARDGEESLNNRLKRDLYVDNIPLKQKVLDIEGLKEMQDLEYETNSGYKVCQNTKNGVVNDLKLHGRSLVNLLNYSSLTTIGSASGTFTKSGNFIKSTLSSSGSKVAVLKSNMDINNKIVTVIIDNKSTSQFCDFGKKAGYETIKNLQKGINVFTVNTNNLQDGIYVGHSGTLNNGDIIEFSIMILEGDHTQNPPSYFEGIASAGSVTPLEVMASCKNLFDESIMESRLESDGYYHFRTTGNTKSSLFFGIVDNANKQVSAMSPNNDLDLTGRDLTGYKVLIGINGDKVDDKISFPIENFPIGRFNIFKNVLDIVMVDYNHIKIKKTYINYGMVDIGYSSFKCDKKTILFKDVDKSWKPVTELNEFDILDSTRKKLYKNSSNITYRGTSSENWTLSSSSDATLVFKIPSPNGSNANQHVICDKFNFFRQSWDASNQKEGISFDSNGNTYVQIFKSRLTTLDSDGFKSWLQSNYINIIYATLNSVIYEISPLDLESFENETVWMIKGGPVSPHAEFKVTSSIQNFAKNTAERVDRLEDEVYKMNLANFAVSLNALELKSRLEALEAPKQ